MTHSWGSKFMAIVFSFIFHTENYHFMGIGIHGSDLPQKPRKLVPHEIKAIHTVFHCLSFALVVLLQLLTLINSTTYFGTARLTNEKIFYK